MSISKLHRRNPYRYWPPERIEQLNRRKREYYLERLLAMGEAGRAEFRAKEAARVKELRKRKAGAAA